MSSRLSASLLCLSVRVEMLNSQPVGISVNVTPVRNEWRSSQLTRGQRRISALCAVRNGTGGTTEAIRARKDGEGEKSERGS